MPWKLFKDDSIVERLELKPHQDNIDVTSTMALASNSSKTAKEADEAFHKAKRQ